MPRRRAIGSWDRLVVSWVSVALAGATGFAGWIPPAGSAERRIEFYHPDHLGSTHLVTDQQGRVIERLEYAPFGALVTRNGPATVAHTFTGQRRDAPTGLSFYHARYYDPQLGRFITPDRIVPSPADPAALNRYSYVQNNPIRFTDPSGNFLFIPVLLALAKIAAVVSLGAGIAGLIAGGTGHPHAANTFFKIAGFSGSLGVLAGGFTLFNVATAAALVTSTGLSFSSSDGAQQASRILGWTALGLQVGQGVADYLASRARLVFPQGSGMSALEAGDGLAVNGILNDAAGAQSLANRFGVPALHNPSTSLVSDLVESAIEKFFPFLPGDAMARQTSDALLRLAGTGKPLRLYFHSQGTIIGANALARFARAGGQLPAGSSASFFGPAVISARAQSAFLHAMGGHAGTFGFTGNFADPVYSIFGTLNPIQIVSGAAAGILTLGRYHMTELY